MKYPKKVSEHIVSWIDNYINESGVKGIVVGVSGGVDSALTSTLCAETGQNVLCLEMPIYQNKDQVSRSEKHIDWLKSEVFSLARFHKIINEIIASLVNVDPDLKNISKVKDAATVAAKGILRVGAGILGGTAGSNVMDEVLESSNSIRDLRLELTNLVDEIRTSSNQRVDKIVIFVDDLDRIDPPEAVKILELLKNIFSIPGCVFVLAIDYQVVIKGLKEKFGERTPENEWEFRAFFDKIIQLPFLMPMGSYDIGHYVNDLLRQIGFQDENEIDGEFVSNVVNYTIGGNPRSIKRLINSLALIKIFNDSVDDDEDEIITNDVMTERQLQFALVCLQIASSDVYSLLSANPDFEKWDDDLAFSYTQKKEEQDPKFAENFELLTKEELFDEEWEKSLYRICYANPRERAKATDLSRFFNFLNKNLGDKCDLPQSIALALGQTSVTSVVSTDDVQRAPKGSYKRNYATGFEGWIEEITIRHDDLPPHKDLIDATKNIINVWQGPEFNAVDWKQGDTPEGYNIRYAGSAALYYSTKKLGNIHIKDYKKGKDAKIQINVLKNPKWENQIVRVGEINFNHHRPISIDKEEKKILKGGAGYVEWMWADVDKLEMIRTEIISLLFSAAMKTRTELNKDMLHRNQVQAYIQAFQSNRKDSKVWAEAVDFLDNYFNEDNRVELTIDG